MKIRYLLLIGILINSVIINAQIFDRQNISTNGGQIHPQLQQNIGEQFISLLSNNSAMLTQGFIQPGSILYLPSIIGDSSLCIGSTTQLFDSIIGGVWSSNNNNIVSVAQNGTITANNIGTAQIFYTFVDVEVSITIIVNGLPLVTAGIDQTICNGIPIILFGSGAISYSWSGGVSNNQIFIPSVTSNYIVSGTDGNGCVNIDTILVTVNPTPAAAVIANGPTILCAGSNILLNANNGVNYNYQWFNNGVNINGAINNSFYTSIAGIYSVMVTNSFGCSNFSNDITINPLPSVTAGIDQTICNGIPITLFGSGAMSYSWSGGVINNQIFFPSVTSNYIVTGTDSNGCINIDTVLVTINSLPSVNAGMDQTICNGSPVTLFASGAMNYSWSGGVINNQIFIPAATSNYIVIGADSNGCINTDTVLVIVNPIPAAAIIPNGPTTLCAGGSVVLNANNGANLNYQWMDNGVNINGAINNSFYTSIPGIYSAKVTNTFGCSDLSNDVTVIVNPVPISQQIIGNPSITPFQPYTYIVNNTAGNTYTWIPQNGAVQTGQGTNSVNVIWAGSGPYSITLIQTNAYGCSDTTSLMVINSSCNLPININTIIPAQLCSGDTVLLIAQVSSLPATYQWIKNGQILNSQTNDTLLVTSTGNYQVQVTSSGCTNISNNTPVSFLPSPSVPVITSLGNTGSCVAPSIVLKANGGPYQSYLWNTGITADTMIATSSGNYNVTVTGSNGCQAKSTDFPVNISVLPVFPICLVTVDSSTGYNNVVWEKPTIVGVDSFFIYREGSQLNVYEKIGAKEKNEFSMFTDSNSNVNQQSYKYKVAVLDTCGNITLMSDYHKTIHLTVNQGLGNVWNLIWNAYEGFTYSSYNIYRGNNTGSLQLLTTISSANNSYTDVNPPANVNYYLVEVISPNGCFPTAKTASQNSTISNFVSIISTNVNETSWNKKPIYVYPNPSNGVYNIVCNAELNAEITDVTGRKITKIKNVKNIDISNQACGVYFLKLSDENGGLQKIIELIKK